MQDMLKLHNKIINITIDILKEKYNYKEDLIVTEKTIKKVDFINDYFDLILLDEENNRPKICFEVKICKDLRKTILFGINQFKRNRKFIPDATMFILVLCYEENIYYFDVSTIIIEDIVEVGGKITNFINNKEKHKELILLENRKNNFLNSQKRVEEDNIIKRKHNNQSIIKIILLIIDISIIVGCIILDALDVYKVTYERIILIGILLILIFIPFIKEINFMNVGVKIKNAKDK